MATGMDCPYCGHNDWKVTDTRAGPDKVLRRRRCLNCGSVCKTHERLATADMEVTDEAKRMAAADLIKVLADEVLDPHGG